MLTDVHKERSRLGSSTSDWFIHPPPPAIVVLILEFGVYAVFPARQPVSVCEWEQKASAWIVIVLLPYIRVKSAGG
jgi:hypothetical protein